MRTRSTFERNPYLALLVIVAMTSCLARAQDAEAPKVDTEVPKAPEATQAVEPTEVRDGSTRSPAAAVWMSVGSTLVPAALGGGLIAANLIAGGVILSTGLVFGPSIGQYYSGRVGKGLLFTLGRAAFAGMAWGGLIWVLLNCYDHEGNCHTTPVGGITLLTISGAGVLGLAIWDIVNSYSSAEQYNEEHAKKSISLSPFVMPSAGRNGENGTAYGLAVAGWF